MIERIKGDKKLYRILRDLECRLQELGERGDYGVPTEPVFAIDTLLSAITYIASTAEAKNGLLSRALAQNETTGRNSNAIHVLRGLRQ